MRLLVALSLVLSAAGCSFVFVRSAKSACPPYECRSKRLPAYVDMVVAIAATVTPAYLVAKAEDDDGGGEDHGNLDPYKFFQGPAVLGVTLFGAAALYGHATANECDRLEHVWRDDQATRAARAARRASPRPPPPPGAPPDPSAAPSTRPSGLVEPW